MVGRQLCGQIQKGDPVIDRASIVKALRSYSLVTSIPPDKAMPAVKRFVGAKNGMGVWQRIISEMPLHHVYVEPFLGTGIVLRRKAAAAISIASDIDPAAPGLASVDGPCTISLVGDALRILSTLMPMMDRQWLVYVDPPYLFSSRSCKTRYYKYEFGTPGEHQSLLTILKQLNCNVMLSGYRNDLYDEEISKWRSVQIPTSKHNGARATEVIWMNFDEPLFLHDTRYLGKNFRERERIKRKRTRWVSRIHSMSRLDRAAILDAINDVINLQLKP